MKNTKIFILLLLFAANTLQGQEPLSALFQGNNTPDSIVQITTILPGATQAQTLTVEVTDGWARVEGDIVLGRIEELQKKAQDRGVVLEGGGRWPGGEIPYFISSGFTPEYVALIHESIEYINGATHLNIHPATDSFSVSFLTFKPSNVCESSVGRTYFGQTISLMDIYASGNNGGCDFHAIIHEIAHAAGLWHEQSREDRDTYVTINWFNIESGKWHNFFQQISDGIDIGPYDFASVMHYGPNAFSWNGQPTITAKNGEFFGGAQEYSLGDVAAINWMYPTKACAANYNLEYNIPVVGQPLHYESSGMITSKSAIPWGNQVIYDAGNLITLAPGFRATSGCTFRATIDGCGGAVQSLASPDEQEWILEAQNHQPVSEEVKPPISKQAYTDQAALVNVMPNPFTASTTISYTLPADQQVDIQIFNTIGGLVAQPVKGELQTSGLHEYRFEAGDLPTGIYFLVMQTGGQKQTKRLVVTR